MGFITRKRHHSSFGHISTNPNMPSNFSVSGFHSLNQLDARPRNASPGSDLSFRKKGWTSRMFFLLVAERGIENQQRRISKDLSPWWSWCSFIRSLPSQKWGWCYVSTPNDCVWRERNRRPVASWWVLLFSPNWLGGGLKHLSKWSTLSECLCRWVSRTHRLVVCVHFPKIRKFPGNHRFSLGDFQADPVGPAL